MGTLLGVGCRDCFCLGSSHKLILHVSVPKERTQEKYFNFRRWNKSPLRFQEPTEPCQAPHPSSVSVSGELPRAGRQDPFFREREEVGQEDKQRLC